MLAFDTHAAVKRLQQAGADESLAEAVVSTFGSMLNETVATKSDIADLRATTKSDIADLRAATKTDIVELRADLKSAIATLETRFTNKLYAGIAALLVLSKVLDWLIG